MAAEQARVRFVRALYALAVGTGALPERVQAAWTELLPLRRDDLPERLREAYGQMEAEMLAAPDDPTTLSEEGAVAAAERILRLAVEVWGG
jgi:hypothetical protein